MEHQKWKLQVAVKIRKAYGRINGLDGAYDYHYNVNLIKYRSFELVGLLASLVFMDNEMSHVHGDDWSTGFSQSNDSLDDNTEQQSSLAFPQLIPGPNFVPEPCVLGQGGGETDIGQFGLDINQMVDDPFRNLGHRRAQSEIMARPDNGINFDGNLGPLSGGGYGPFISDENGEPDLSGIYVDMDRLNSSSAMPSLFQVGEPSSAAAAAALPPPLPPPSAVAGPLAAAAGSALGLGSGSAESPSGERLRVRHQYSQSADGSLTIHPELLVSSSQVPSGVERKKALSAAKLAELALVDPRRAKRILSNRQSAARSKERKMRYIAELEKKVQTLQTQATALSTQLTLLQGDTTGLHTENHELKYRLQTMEQQVQLQDALNDALKDEIEHLKVLTGQAMPNGAPAMMPLAPRPLFYPPNNSDPRPLVAAAQQLQIQPPESQHLFRVQHHQLPLQLQLSQLQQPTGDFSFRGPAHLAIQGDDHPVNNPTMPSRANGFGAL